MRMAGSDYRISNGLHKTWSNTWIYSTFMNICNNMNMHYLHTMVELKISTKRLSLCCSKLGLEEFSRPGRRKGRYTNVF